MRPEHFFTVYPEWLQNHLLPEKGELTGTPLTTIHSDQAELIINTLARWQSPSSESIDWLSVTDAAKSLLQLGCLDWRLLHAASQAALSSHSEEDTRTLSGCLSAMWVMITPTFWDQTYPKRSRHKFANQTILCLGRWLQKQPNFRPKGLDNLLSESAKCADDISLEWPGELKDILEKLNAIQSKTITPTDKTPQQASHDQSANAIPPASETALNSSPQKVGIGRGPRLPNDTDAAQRDRKRALQSVNQHCQARGPLSIEGLSLNRITLWHDIDTLPPMDANGHCPLLPPPEDICTAYSAGLTLDGDELISRWVALEKTLTNAPFWLDGQALAVRYAHALEEHKKADVINAFVIEVLERFPKILDARFKDGKPMLTAENHDLFIFGSDAAVAKNQSQQKRHVDDFIALPPDVAALEPDARVFAIEAILAKQPHKSRNQALLLLHQAQAYGDMGQHFAEDALKNAAKQFFPSELIYQWDPELNALLHPQPLSKEELND